MSHEVTWGHMKSAKVSWGVTLGGRRFHGCQTRSTEVTWGHMNTRLAEVTKDYTFGHMRSQEVTFGFHKIK